MTEARPLTNILKKGAVLEAKILDYSDPKLKKQLEEVRKMQDQILACKNVDWEKMAHTYITI
jgi:phosphoribosylcarboxyaminoimidazole (NCAIR) mutase